MAQIFILAENRKYVRFFLENCLKKKYSRDIRNRENVASKLASFALDLNAVSLRGFRTPRRILI